MVKKVARLNIGDCFAIPLPDGRYAYGQYVFFHTEPDGYGYLIRVFKIISTVIIDVTDIQGAELLFPPVFVGLPAAIRKNRWRMIGLLPIENFSFPLFRATNGYGAGTFHDWRIWDGQKYRFIGDLPDELHSLEVLAIWGAELLEERIAYGVNPFAQLK